MVEKLLNPPGNAPGDAATTPASSTAAPVLRTIWGLEPVVLYDRYWAAHGIQVVRQGEPSAIVDHCELYLLNDPQSFTLFPLQDVMDTLNWIKPAVLFVRLHDSRERGYRERVVTDEFDQFIKFQRVYDASWRLTRLVLTPEKDIAQLWQNSPDPESGWKRLRRYIRKSDRAIKSVDGNVYDRGNLREVSYFIHDLVRTWHRPDATIARAHTGMGQVWRDPQSVIDPRAKFIGPVWVGAGRNLPYNTTVIGPAVVWDDPAARPPVGDFRWQDIEPTTPPEVAPPPRQESALDLAAKRAFDIAFALFGILMTIWLYPFICLAIWLEDGRPFFFGHERETLHGNKFKCWKFRSMRKDAEQIKEQLKAANQADGPQFFMENDPRLTRVGKFLRKYNFDEFPQFWNVLTGEMSVVGPRPSPEKENQYCPPWREARLSVRPGITGLWQVKRTRRAGNDFQEWIRYDMEYVEKRNFWMDIGIIFKTVAAIFGKVSKN